VVTVDLNSAEPLEEQIRREIQQAVALGTIKPGDALPSVRQLAGDLGIHWNTVARAYRRLRDDGLLAVGRGRTVTVSRAVISRLDASVEASEIVRGLLDAAFTQAKLRGLTYRELREAVDRSLKHWREAWEGTPQ
jgi:GntR family transcriptional regulator